jgi:hypothetical protein
VFSSAHTTREGASVRWLEARGKKVNNDSNIRNNTTKCTEGVYYRTTKLKPEDYLF